MTEKTGVTFHKEGGISFKEHPPCRIFSCANCPFRRGYMCFYRQLTNKNGD